jgi:hypothetical protein
MFGDYSSRIKSWLRRMIMPPSVPAMPLPTFLTSCIIQDQPDHLVLALRIPKATVNANIALMIALADFAGDGFVERNFPG